MSNRYDEIGHSEFERHATAVVRHSAGSAAIAAVLLCAYGFGMLAAPDPNDLFSWSNWFFFYTLRIGGIAYAMVAVWCLRGRPAALLANGVLSVLVGVMFMLCGVGMFVDGGVSLNSVLITVFGWLFAGAGVRDYREYRHLVRGTRSLSDELHDGRDALQRVRPEPTTPPYRKQVEHLSDKVCDVEQPQSCIETIDHVYEVPSSDTSHPSPPSDGGYLAKLAKKDRPPRL